MMISDPNPSGRFAIIIPVYNHGATLRGVVAKALGLDLPVFVVDDGSTDGGAHTVEHMPGVQLIRHAANQGKGAALMTGFQAAAARQAQWAVTLDADGQHNPDDARVLMDAIAPGQRPIVVGCRQQMLNQGAPWTSRFGRGFSNFWVRMSGGPSVADSQSGLRIYPLPEVLHLGVRARRYQFEVEVLVKAARHQMPVCEAPISVIYPPGSQRVSHFRPFVDFLRNSSTFTRLMTQRVFSRFNRIDSIAGRDEKTGRSV